MQAFNQALEILLRLCQQHPKQANSNVIWREPMTFWGDNIGWMLDTMRR